MVCEILPFDIMEILKNCKDQVATFKDVLTVIGILIAGYYGYMRLLHGKIWHPRVTPTLELTIVKKDDKHWLVATAKIQNVGLRSVSFKGRQIDIVFDALYFDQSAYDPISLDQQQSFSRVGACTVFEDENYLAAGETIEDTATLLTNKLDVDLYNAEFRISGQSDEVPWLWRHNIAWSVSQTCSTTEVQTNE